MPRGHEEGLDTDRDGRDTQDQGRLEDLPDVVNPSKVSEGHSAEKGSGGGSTGSDPLRQPEDSLGGGTQGSSVAISTVQKTVLETGPLVVVRTG